MDFIEGIIYMIWRGIAIGVIISAPMGPVGILCVQRTLEKGRQTGFFTGVGAAVSDLVYCLLTGFGLSLIEGFLKENQNVIQIVGSVVLILFGVYLFKSNPARTLKKPETQRNSVKMTVLSGFLFTFSNPLIIFLIIGLFARFNFLLPEISAVQYFAGFISIIIGALMWWWLVSFFIDKVRSHFNLRSMWLVNKITGGIIMVFALVGIITAVNSMAKADTREPVYLNSTRGFGSLGGDSGGGRPLRIEALNHDTVYRFLPLGRAEEFSFSFRCSNINNEPGKTYKYRQADGLHGRVAHCPWGVALLGNDARMLFQLRTVDNRRDDILPEVVRVSAVSADGTEVVSDVTDGLDFYSGQNSYRLVKAGGKVMLLGGNRKYDLLLETDCLGPGGMTADFDSVGIWVAPGGCVEIDNVSFRVLSESLPRGRQDVSHFADPDVRASYFSRSLDPIEGVWEMFDRTLDDDLLRNGGDYRLALVRSGKNYEMIYLQGAEKLSDRWHPGMIKGYMYATDFKGVFDMKWLDPSGSPLRGEIKAQFSSPDIIVVQFPEHAGSTLRLRKIKEYYGKR